jgi:hypothetical protein
MPNTPKQPTITAIMVTDGKYKAEIAALAKHDACVSVVHAHGKMPLGWLRNLALDYATDLSIQWDDDDWYAPNRMALQWEALHNCPGKSAVMLVEQLHYMRDSGEVGWVCDPGGIEGTILLDKRCGYRYPEKTRGEDTELKVDLAVAGLLQLTGGGTCYCRTFTGRNTWDREHHLRRIRTLGKPATEMQRRTSELTTAAKFYGWKTDWRILPGDGNGRGCGS